MAPKDPPGGLRTPHHKAILLKSLHGILGTGGHESTGWLFERRDVALIDTNEENEKPDGRQPGHQQLQPPDFFPVLFILSSTVPLVPQNLSKSLLRSAKLALAADRRPITTRSPIPSKKSRFLRKISLMRLLTLFLTTAPPTLRLTVIPSRQGTPSFSKNRKTSQCPTYFCPRLWTRKNSSRRRSLRSPPKFSPSDRPGPMGPTTSLLLLLPPYSRCEAPSALLPAPLEGLPPCSRRHSPSKTMSPHATFPMRLVCPLHNSTSQSRHHFCTGFSSIIWTENRSFLEFWRFTLTVLPCQVAFRFIGRGSQGRGLPLAPRPLVRSRIAWSHMSTLWGPSPSREFHAPTNRRLCDHPVCPTPIASPVCCSRVAQRATRPVSNSPSNAKSEQIQANAPDPISTYLTSHRYLSTDHIRKTACTNAMRSTSSKNLTLGRFTPIAMLQPNTDAIQKPHHQIIQTKTHCKTKACDQRNNPTVRQRSLLKKAILSNPQRSRSAKHPHKKRLETPIAPDQQFFNRHDGRTL